MKIKWISSANGILGLLLLIVPFTLSAQTTFGYNGSSPAFWNSVIVGILIGAFSFWEAMKTENWNVSTIVSVLGIWLIFAPYLMGYSEIRPIFWSNLIIGLTVALLANYQTMRVPRHLILHGRH